MKLLLDENLPHQLRLELPGYDVSTAAYMGWSGIENAESLPLTVVVIMAKANTIGAIRPVCPALLDALSVAKPQQFLKVAAP